MHPLKRLIYKKGYTINEFCMKCGVNRATLYKIFDGKTQSPIPRTVYLISKKLNEPYEVVYALCTEGL